MLFGRAYPHSGSLLRDWSRATDNSQPHAPKEHYGTRMSNAVYTQDAVQSATRGGRRNPNTSSLTQCWNEQFNLFTLRDSDDALTITLLDIGTLASMSFY